MEEAQGFRALLGLEEPKYSIEQIAARTGKNPSYIAARLKLAELIPTVVDAFYKDEIGVGHALLLASCSLRNKSKPGRGAFAKIGVEPVETAVSFSLSATCNSARPEQINLNLNQQPS